MTPETPMNRTLTLLLACVALPVAIVAQADGAAYYAQLDNLDLRHTGSAGGEGRLTPDLTTRGAIDDCNKGDTAAGIRMLEEKPRGAPRSSSTRRSAPSGAIDFSSCSAY